MNIVEARFDIDRQLVELAAKNGAMPLVRHVRFFPYPCCDDRLVLACAELVDGDDIQAVFELSTPVDPDDFDEEAVRQMFLDVPSGAKH
jgi:hypothetical protein